eukprot:5709153-Pleurochrysis_carterae.AAC.1
MSGHAFAGDSSPPSQSPSPSAPLSTRSPILQFSITPTARRSIYAISNTRYKTKFDISTSTSTSTSTHTGISTSINPRAAATDLTRAGAATAARARAVAHATNGALRQPPRPDRTIC